MNAKYYAAVLTMAEHTDRPDMRARALGMLTEVLAAGPPPPGRGVYIHDGREVIHATVEAALLLGGQPRDFEGRALMALVHESERVRIARRVKERTTPGWKAPIVCLDGRPVPTLRLDGSCVAMANVVTPIIWNGKPAVQVAMVDIAAYARLS